MLNKTLKNKTQLRHLFDVGQEVFYSCLIIHYEWFSKTLLIEELVEPTKLKVLRHKLYPDQLTKSDSILIQKMNLSNIINKYKFYIELEEKNDIKMTIFEDRKKEIHVLHESNKIMGYNEIEVTKEFIRLLISTKRDMDFDLDETILIEDEIFELFETLYSEAIEEYPEEAIKIHGNQF